MVQKITALRAEHKAFQRGSWYPLPCKDDVFAYVRDLGDESYLCLFNRNTVKSRCFSHGAVKDRKGLELLTNNEEDLEQIILEPLSAKIYKIIGGRIILHGNEYKEKGIIPSKYLTP